MEPVAEYDRQWYSEEPYLQLWWHGWPIVKHPNDLMMYQEIIWQTRPDVIVETGTYSGGSALFLAHMLDILGQDGRVISIDIEPAQTLPEHDRITYVRGSSTDFRALDVAEEAAKGKKTMVILDSDHREEHVLRELSLYSPLVSKGCYLIVEDTHPLAKYEGYSGPMAGSAVRKWNPEKHGFDIDKRRERLLFSQNPGGYLRRSQPEAR